MWNLCVMVLFYDAILLFELAYLMWKVFPHNRNQIFFILFSIWKTQELAILHILIYICRKKLELSGKLAQSQSELPVRRMLDSYQEACIPLGSHPDLRENYINFFNRVRFGRISEDLDTMAGELKMFATFYSNV